MQLVPESLPEYNSLNENELIKEDMSPQDLTMLINYVAGTIGVFLTAGGISVIQNKLKNSKGNLAQKLGVLLSKLGKSAAEGTRKAPSPTNENLNEAADPDLIAAAQYIGGALAVILSAGGLELLQRKLAKNKSNKVQKFGKFLTKLGSSSAEGTSKAPKSI